ncbi:MAG: cobalamin-binding protein [Chloroflexi bacterium]|nr:cobalamin-binding protein [Chloroflexota bacterium]
MSLETIYDAVLRGDANVAESEVKAAIDNGTAAEEILHQACIPAMTEVGRQFEIGEKFVPEMLIAARAMQVAVNILKPLLVEADIKALGKVVIGTVAGDLHDIGKNLVGMMLEGAGFEIIDLGTNVAPEKFVAAVQENEIDMVGMSALLTTTMPSITATIEALTEAGVRNQVKVIIGGAPITQDFADKIGADGFAADAGSAPRVAKALLGVE